MLVNLDRLIEHRNAGNTRCTETDVEFVDLLNFVLHAGDADLKNVHSYNPMNTDYFAYHLI